ncbi:hypothetical protein ACFOVU_25860 [Nocardiopsis sediminis]|uniref:Uncharacterized protein n=1 Tax=Nocardiopsis sediminis TaxID=1778267 RepID=A0ABV8FXZ8_9ACTN
MPEQAAEAIAGGDPPSWGVVERFVAEKALNVIWDGVKVLVVPWDLANLIRTMRIFAVLVCPDPGAHQQVARLCLVPLATDVLTDTAEARLHQGLGQVLDPG